jgi:arginase
MIRLIEREANYMDKEGRSIIVVDAPMNLGLSPPGPGREPGVCALASALRANGILSRLGAMDGGAVASPLYTPKIDPSTGVLGGEALRSFSMDLAERVGAVVQEGKFPFVLGGDCSILLGNMLALRRRGRFGLVFIDGHLDFRHPGNSELVGAAAGADLALVSGRGPDRLANIEGLGPLVRDDDTVALGEREDYPEWRDIHDTDITVWDLWKMRSLGVNRVALKTLEKMEASGVEGFWVHLDADVLDDAIMPAVDSRQPDGLGYAELIELLRPLLGSSLVAGMQVTIFDPELDRDGKIAAKFTDALVEAFSSTRRVVQGTLNTRTRAPSLEAARRPRK